MGAREQLRVRVDDKLVLDAGTCEEVLGPHGPERLIRPPATTLFHHSVQWAPEESAQLRAALGTAMSPGVPRGRGAMGESANEILRKVAFT